MLRFFAFWCPWLLGWGVTAVCAWLLLVAGLLWLPGDPAALWLDQPQVAAQVRAAWVELVQPTAGWTAQIRGVVDWFVAGLPGTSWSTGQPVRSLVLSATGATAHLLTVILVLGVSLGLWLVSHPARTVPGARGRARVSLSLLVLPDILLLCGLLVGAGLVGASVVPSAADRLIGRSAPLVFWGPVSLFALQVALVLEQQLAPRWQELAAAPLGPWLATRGWSSARIRRLHLRSLAPQLWRTLRLLIPAIAGSLVLVERVTQRPGVGGLVIDSLSQRDLPVALAASTALLLLSWTLTAFVGAAEHREVGRRTVPARADAVPTRLARARWRGWLGVGRAHATRPSSPVGERVCVAGDSPASDQPR